MEEEHAPAVRKALLRAREEAVRLGSEAAKPEHILLALLLEEDCQASGFLNLLEIDVERVRGEIEKSGKPPAAGEAVAWRHPFSPSARGVVEFAEDLCRWMGEKRVKTHHLLLSLVNDPDRYPASLLASANPAGTDFVSRIHRLIGAASLGAERDELLKAIADVMGMEVVGLDALEIPADVLLRISADVAEALEVIPIRFEDGVLTVAMADPYDVNVLPDLKSLLCGKVRGAMASERSVKRALARHYGRSGDRKGSFLREILEDLRFDDVGGTEGLAGVVAEMVNSAQTVMQLNLMLSTAIRAEATDIQFELFEEEFKVRYRVGRELHEMEARPHHLAVSIIARIKMLARLDLAKTRTPQVGRIVGSFRDRPIGLVVSTRPGEFGESADVHVE